MCVYQKPKNPSFLRLQITLSIQTDERLGDLGREGIESFVLTNFYMKTLQGFN